VWQQACYTLWSSKSDGARRTAFSKARNTLQDNGRIDINGGIVSVSDDVSGSGLSR
jgi:hypothetical protein